MSVCRTGKYCMNIKIAKPISKKRKKSSFYEEKSLVGLTPAEKNKFRTFKILAVFKTKENKFLILEECTSSFEIFGLFPVAQKEKSLQLSCFTSFLHYVHSCKISNTN
jgi:hypothetical protein